MARAPKKAAAKKVAAKKAAARKKAVPKRKEPVEVVEAAENSTVLLNPRHELFAQEIAKGSSQRDAYRAAGYSTTTDDTTDQAASRLSSDVRVIARVAEIQKNAAKRAEITVEKVLMELSKIGFSDIRSVVKWGEAVAVEDEDGNLVAAQGVSIVDADKMDETIAACISEIRKTRDGIAIKLHDKRAALVDIGRHLQMFTERHEVTGPNGGAIPIQNSFDLSGLTADERRALLPVLTRIAGDATDD